MSGTRHDPITRRCALVTLAAGTAASLLPTGADALLAEVESLISALSARDAAILAVELNRTRAIAESLMPGETCAH